MPFREPELGCEQISVGVERIQQQIDTTWVMTVSQRHSIVKRVIQCFLLCWDLARLPRTEAKRC